MLRSGGCFPGPRGVVQPGRRLGGTGDFGGLFGHKVFMVRAASSEAGPSDYTRCPEPLLYAHPESTRARASFYTAKGPAGDVLQVGELPTPSPAPGEVRVRVGSSGVNLSDVNARAGVADPAMRYARVSPDIDA